MTAVDRTLDSIFTLFQTYPIKKKRYETNTGDDRNSTKSHWLALLYIIDGSGESNQIQRWAVITLLFRQTAVSNQRLDVLRPFVQQYIGARQTAVATDADQTADAVCNEVLRRSPSP